MSPLNAVSNFAAPWNELLNSSDLSLSLTENPVRPIICLNARLIV